jgi:hypothetical protein
LRTARRASWRATAVKRLESCRVAREPRATAERVRCESPTGTHGSGNREVGARRVRVDNFVRGRPRAKETARPRHAIDTRATGCRGGAVSQASGSTGNRSMRGPARSEVGSSGGQPREERASDPGARRVLGVLGNRSPCGFRGRGFANGSSAGQPAEEIARSSMVRRSGNRPSYTRRGRPSRGSRAGNRAAEVAGARGGERPRGQLRGRWNLESSRKSESAG